MRGLSAVVKKSQSIDQHNWSSWVKIYYDFETDTVSTKQTDNNFFVTSLCNPNTKEDIIEAIERWKRL